MKSERRDEILQAAHAIGYDLTGDQLERWHRAGLISRPQQIGLGRGAGSVNPSGTTRQVLAGEDRSCSCITTTGATGCRSRP